MATCLSRYVPVWKNSTCQVNVYRRLLSAQNAIFFLKTFIPDSRAAEGVGQGGGEAATRGLTLGECNASFDMIMNMKDTF